MFPPWLIAVAFGVALLLTVWFVLERVTEPGVSVAWAHSRRRPDAAREPFTLGTDPDERGASLRPGLRGTRAAQTAQHSDAAGQGGEPG